LPPQGFSGGRDGYALQLRYHNGANQIKLGIGAGVKWLAIKDESGAIVAQGVVQLPRARIGRAYKAELSDFYNMSYLQSNSSFSAAGGVEGPSNRFDIYGVRLLRVR
jgi:hypothetical protein